LHKENTPTAFIQTIISVTGTESLQNFYW